MTIRQFAGLALLLVIIGLVASHASPTRSPEPDHDAVDRNAVEFKAAAPSPTAFTPPRPGPARLQPAANVPPPSIGAHHVPGRVQSAAAAPTNGVSRGQNMGGPQRLTIIDRNGFGQPMPAFTVETPAGWEGGGMVFWDTTNSCLEVVPSMNWQARSPDGSQTFEVLPRWASSAQPPDPTNPVMLGCPVAPFEDVRGYLTQLAQQRHPGGRILDYRQRPDLLDTVSVPAVANFPESPITFRNRAEAGEILIGWQENGREMRESIQLAGLVMESVTTQPFTGTRREVKLILNAPVALRAPNGQLDVNLLSRMARSIKPEPGWLALMQRHHGIINADTARTIANIGQIKSETSKDLLDISHRGWTDRDRITAEGHRKAVDVTRDVQPYHDPYKDYPVELSNQYKFTWRLQDGTYHQTDDPFWSPWNNLRTEGQLLEPVR